jgi:hypothetical protein
MEFKPKQDHEVTLITISKQHIASMINSKAET